MPTSSNDQTAVANLTTDLFAPAAFDTLFLRPRFLVDEQAVAHVPLVFWACAALRPRKVAVLGVGAGSLHFAFCQAMEKAKGAGRCTGYVFRDDTDDDADSTGDPIPADLRQHQAMLYEDVSRLVAAKNIDKLVDGLAERSLDILVVDLNAAPEGMAQRLEPLMHSLDSSGILMVHGGDDLDTDSAGAAALQRFAKGHRTVHFAHEGGLQIFARDKDTAPQLDALLATSDRTAPPAEVERVFRRVGQGLLGSVRAEQERDARIEAEERASQNQEARDAAEKLNESLNEAYDLRNHKLAEIQSELYDARLSVTEMKAQLTALETEKQSLAAAHESEKAAQAAALESEKATLAAAHEAEKEALAAAHADALAKERQEHEQTKAAKDELHESLAELVATHEASLREVSDQRLAAEKALKTEQEARFRETAALTQMLETLKKEIGALKKRHQTALTSQQEDHAKHDHLRAQLNATKEQQQRELAKPQWSRANRRAKAKVEEDMNAVAASGLFDAEWYLATYSDVAQSGADPLRHFVLSGCYELRNPGPDFDSLKYHQAHPDVSAAGMPALIHYAHNGSAENRQTFRVGEG